MLLIAERKREKCTFPNGGCTNFQLRRGTTDGYVSGDVAALSDNVARETGRQTRTPPGMSPLALATWQGMQDEQQLMETSLFSTSFRTI